MKTITINISLLSCVRSGFPAPAASLPGTSTAADQMNYLGTLQNAVLQAIHACNYATALVLALTFASSCQCRTQQGHVGNG